MTRAANGPAGAGRPDTGQDADLGLARANAAAAAGALDQAAALYGAILAAVPSHAEAHNNLGNVLMAQDRSDEAIDSYRRALAHGLDHHSVHYNLALALRRRRRPHEALTALNAALRLNPTHADGHNALGNVLRDLNRVVEAAAAYLAALRLNPVHTVVPHNLAAVAYLVHEADAKASRTVVTEWLALTPDGAVAQHVAGSLDVTAMPARANDTYVRETFNHFAAEFEARLTDLDYRAPAQLRDLLALHWPPATGSADVLDAGCGTGLCAGFLRPYARHLSGVDLSPGMLAQARTRGLYDALHEAELTSFLAGTSDGFDIILAADVLCYFGALGPILTAAATALRRNGRLLFSLERLDGGGSVRLQATGRYQHRTDTVITALGAAGLTVLAHHADTLRQESGHPVPGLLIVATPSR